MSDENEFLHRASFPEQRYLWRCGACNFVPAHRDDWDDTPGARFCPYDGLPLERVSCPHCDAPVMWQPIAGPHGITVQKVKFCVYCGRETAVVEKQMRMGPKIAPPRDPLVPKITKVEVKEAKTPKPRQKSPKGLYGDEEKKL